MLIVEYVVDREVIVLEILTSYLGNSRRQYPNSPTRSRTAVLENNCSRKQLFSRTVVTRSYDSTECESSTVGSDQHRM